MNSLVLRAQRDIVSRYRRISNLYVAYTNSNGTEEEYGREFVIAVGELLEGKTIEQLELFHISTEDVEDVVSYGRKEARDENRTKKRPYQRPQLRCYTRR